MSIIYVPEEMRLKGYGATTKGAKSIVKVEFETANTYALAHLLEQLAEIQQEQVAAQRAAAKSAAAEARPALTGRKTAALAKPQPLLALTYEGGKLR